MSRFGSKMLVPLFRFDTTARGGKPRVAPSKLNEALQGAPPLVSLYMRRTEDIAPFKTIGYIHVDFQQFTSNVVLECVGQHAARLTGVFHRGVHAVSLRGGYATGGTLREASQGCDGAEGSHLRRCLRLGTELRTDTRLKPRLKPRLRGRGTTQCEVRCHSRCSQCSRRLCTKSWLVHSCNSSWELREHLSGHSLFQRAVSSPGEVFEFTTFHT